MSASDRFDPELAAFLANVPLIDMKDVKKTRAGMVGLRPAGSESDDLGRRSGVITRSSVVKSLHGPHQIPVRIYERPDRAATAGVLFIHGGAFALGDLDVEDIKAMRLAVDCDCLVVSVDYRLAPEHPFPAGLDDCYDVLAWMADGVDLPQLDTSRIAVAGTSAGGCLAAGLTLLSRDRSGPAIAFQLLTYPALDSSGSSASAREFVDTPGWDGVNNRLMWTLYLGTTADANVSPYAAPALATDLRGLPPALILTAEFDPLRDEAAAYAGALASADVATRLLPSAGTFHGFETFAYQSAVAQWAIGEQTRAVRAALYDVRRATTATPIAPHSQQREESSCPG